MLFLNTVDDAVLDLLTKETDITKSSMTASIKKNYYKPNISIYTYQKLQ